MPLHHAADKGAPFDVMELLLKTKSEPAAAADKARSSVKMLHRPRAPLWPSTACLCFSPFDHSSSSNRPATPQSVAPRASYAGQKAAPSLRRRHGRAVRCDAAAARGQQRSCERSG
jgi:hypothetical protein